MKATAIHRSTVDLQHYLTQSRVNITLENDPFSTKRGLGSKTIKMKDEYFLFFFIQTYV